MYDALLSAFSGDVSLLDAVLGDKHKAIQHLALSSPIPLYDDNTGFVRDGIFPLFSHNTDPSTGEKTTMTCDFRKLGISMAFGPRTRLCEVICTCVQVHKDIHPGEPLPLILKLILGMLKRFGEDESLSEAAKFTTSKGVTFGLPFLTRLNKAGSGFGSWALRVYYQEKRMCPDSRTLRCFMSMLTVLGYYSTGTIDDFSDVSTSLPDALPAQLFFIASCFRNDDNKHVKKMIQKYLSTITSDTECARYGTSDPSGYTQKGSSTAAQFQTIVDVGSLKHMYKSTVHLQRILDFNSQYCLLNKLNLSIVKKFSTMSGRAFAFCEAIMEMFGYKREDAVSAFSLGNKIDVDPRIAKWTAMQGSSYRIYHDFFTQYNLINYMRSGASGSERYLRSYMASALSPVGAARSALNATSAGEGSISFSLVWTSDPAEMEFPALSIMRSGDVDDSRLSGKGSFPREATYEEVTKYLPHYKALAKKAKMVDIPSSKVFSSVIKSTKKGAFMIYYMTELSLMTSYDFLHTYLTYVNYGRVGSRATPSKDPRLIFLIPFIVHLILNAVAVPITRAVAHYDNVFIRSETGTPFIDHVTSLVGTSAQVDHSLSCDDWGTWDQSLNFCKVNGIVTALIDYLKSQDDAANEPVFFSVIEREPKGYLDLLELAMTRSAAGLFQMPYRTSDVDGQSVLKMLRTQIMRLASGSALTSIIGSFDNLAQLNLMYVYMFQDLQAENIGELPALQGKNIRFTIGDYNAQIDKMGAEYAPLKVEFIDDEEIVSVDVPATTTMGDDIFRIVSISITSNYGGYTSRIALGLNYLFVAKAELMAGEMNVTKSLMGKIAVFVRKMSRMGKMIFRPSVNVLSTESVEAKPILEEMNRILSTLGELTVRGGNPDAIRSFVIRYFQVSAYERFKMSDLTSTKKNQEQWLEAVKAKNVFTSSESRMKTISVNGEDKDVNTEHITYWYPLGTLFSQKGLGYIPSFVYNTTSVMLWQVFASMVQPSEFREVILSDPSGKDILAMADKWYDFMKEQPVLIPQTSETINFSLGEDMVTKVDQFGEYLHSIYPNAEGAISEMLEHGLDINATATHYPHRLCKKNVSELSTPAAILQHAFPKVEDFSILGPYKISSKHIGTDIPKQFLLPSAYTAETTGTTLATFAFSGLDSKVLRVINAFMRAYPQQTMEKVSSRAFFAKSQIPDAYEIFIKTIGDPKFASLRGDVAWVQRLFTAITAVTPDDADKLQQIVMTVLLGGAEGKDSYNDSLLRFATPGIGSSLNQVPEVMTSIALILSDR
jgi:hypothetical protein